MSSRSDETLRRLFSAAAAARAEGGIPSFDRIVARQRSQRRAAHRLAAVAAGLLVVAVLLPVLLLVRQARRERDALEFTRELAAWRAPSDRLLDTHGRFEGPITLFRGLGEPSVLESTNEMVRWR